MSSTGVNVLRWGALTFGIFYGFTHQQAIFAKDKTAAYQHEYDRKQKLIDEAKAKYAEKTTPKTGDGVITNPDDPKFDLEKYLDKVSKQSP
ncbi:related to F1F0-ATP synthase subunit E [Lecanosticta acicola]|uniref:ATP synthase F(0) complex subunit e, mitochondrial n=1 Tax=Lecanosticta acicola TaxID=111012 RepID=A0AAI8YWT5_9PEZI|nr:related to F1F0-ATP synthase subunit E [Lecanosticta acicola]